MGQRNESMSSTSDRKLRKQAVDWLLQLQDCPDDDALHERFQAWLAADPARSVVYDRARRAIGDASHLLSSDLEFTRKAAHKPVARTRTVATAIALLAAGSATFYLMDGPMRLRADILSDVAKPRAVTLSDGSTVNLNAHSAIAIRMHAGERRVTLLRGEAYFEVAADPARPFVVEAGHGTTTALGTAFDVNLTGDHTRIVVTEHAVMVASLSGDTQTQRVPENHEISYDTQGRLGTVEPADAMATAWRQGRLVFEDKPLSAVIEEISRYLPGRIVIPQSQLSERRISGSLDLTAPQAALDGFADAIGIRITRLGPYLTVLRQ